ncbi:MAG TPA: peroxidase, partial [Candidatus Latescibacteria bacterium]|nr:peroxidase [Candidatus Latescibacterota bacterium]
ATPVNWQNGEDVIIIPAVSDEDANKIYSDIRRVKPYLRYVSQPDI